jgi:endonuclease YncB( thermonuclease family)
MKTVQYMGAVMLLTLSIVVIQHFNDPANSTTCNLQGRVVKLADGDSITVLDNEKVQHKIRLSGIDTPERAQPFGKVAKQFLSDKIANKTVCVGWYKKDRYQRLVGVVRLDDQDINLTLVEAGLAWHYTYYQKEQSASDQKRYAKAQQRAEKKQLGLWEDKRPIPPWDWRRGER